MSQSKTIIQGLEPMNESSYGNQGSGMYSRGGGNVNSGAKGTVVPGMMGSGPQSQHTVNAAPDTSAPHQPASRTVASGKPVVGFLYSVSRTPAGEFWPLQVGKNTIGQSSTNDIILSEGTVSGDHAVLTVRNLKNSGKLIANIKDASSTNGTLINGEDFGFEAVELHNGDVITIGDNYELYFILIDAASLGLRKSENFIAVQVEEEEQDDMGFDPFRDGMTRPGGFSPAGGPNFGGYTATSPAGGTVGMDGTLSGNKGGTVGM